jgi:ABC-type branched-subunit amino acid transport system ATPase component
MALLDVNNLSISFGGLRAVDNFNSSVTTDDISASTLADNSATSIVKLVEIDE